MRFLVTGSSGYVASHTVKYLVQHGHSAYGIDEFSPRDTISKYLAQHLVSKIGNSQAVYHFLKDLSLDGVIHCAAKCLVAESMAHPELYEDYNVRQSLLFADVLEKVGLRNIVFSSSGIVYGENQAHLIKEDHPPRPVNPYGQTKYEFEKHLMERAKTNKWSVGIFRYFNVAGADPEAEIGEAHQPETHLIPNAILAGLRKRAFTISGTDYPTRDGTCERDFVHVWDLAQAHCMLLESLVSGSPGDLYNLGSQTGATILEVLNEVERQIGHPIERQIGARRPGDPSRMVADTTKARTVLGWKPYLSNLPSVVATALKWHRKQL